MPQFKMPQLGETVIEGTITRWLKQEGETVEADEPLVEVSTDKVDSEIPAPASGVLNKIVAQEGETVAVGSVIAEIGEAGEAPADEKEAEPAEPTSEPDKEEEPKDPEPAQEPAAQPAAAAAAPTTTPQTTVQTEQEPRRGILSPLVRKLAAEHNVDLGAVRGTGTGGRITKQDIMAAVESGTAQAPAAPSAPSQPADAEPGAAPVRVASGGEEVVRITPMRKAIAEHMVASLRETARAWNTIEIDMTKIAQLRAQAGPAFKQREGFSLTWMPFVSKAVTQVLQKYPQVNSTWNGDGTITVKRYVNLGVAVALENGLIVPVVKGADGMNIAGLARAVRDVADRARKKKLVPDEVQGGTFTITNPGPFGSILSLPIINKGQSAILAFDAVIKRPVVVTDEMGNDSIAIRQMVFLSLSWDHRVIDGAEAAMFLADLKALLEDADFESDLAGYLPTPKT